MTPESNKNLSGRKTIKIGDLAVIYSLIYSPAYKYLFTKQWPKIIDLCVVYYFRFSRALYAFIYWSPIRYKIGSQTVGVFALLLGAANCMIGYNSQEVHNIFKPFSLFITPFLLFGRPKEAWLDFICVNIESKFLLFYSGGVLLSGFVHLMMIWMGKGNKSMSKRGNSYLVLFLSKRIKVNEYFICGVLEPLFFIGIALLLWFEFDDRHGAIFLGVATLSETIQQLLDQVNKKHLESQTSF